jgi:signal transduction histidine kinase
MEDASLIITDAERERAFAEVARHNYASSRLVGRSPKAVGVLLAMIVVFSVALFIPQTQALFALPPEYIVPPMAAYGLNAILASVAMHKAGPLSDLHIRIELVEAALIHVVAGAMIYFAPDVITPYWMFFIMLVVTGAPIYPLTRLPLYATLSTVALVSLAYVWDGAYGDGFAALFLGVTVIYLGWRAVGEQDRFLSAQADKHVLEERLRRRELDVERERISRELHDGVGSELTALLWNVRELVDEAADPAALESTTRRITEELRTVIWDLRDDPSSWQSFCGRLEEVTVNLTKGAGIEAEFRVDGQPPADSLSVDAAHELLRIAQELVHNAVRHAGAARMEVVLEFADDAVRLLVCDDGPGFEPAEVTERGLANVRRRARELDAHFEIASTDRGTRAVVDGVICTLTAA